MEIILRQSLNPQEVARRLNAELPSGLTILDIREDEARQKPCASRLVTYEATLPGKEWPPEGFRRYQDRALTSLPQKSKRGIISIPLEEKLRALDCLGPARLRCTLEQTEGCTIRIRELLAHIFGLSGEELLPARIVKVSSQDLER